MQVDDAEVAFGERAKLVGLHTTVRPDEGETEAERETVPVNPLSPLRVAVDAAEDPEDMVREVRFVAIVKPTTFT